MRVHLIQEDDFLECKSDICIGFYPKLPLIDTKQAKPKLFSEADSSLEYISLRISVQST